MSLVEVNSCQRGGNKLCHIKPVTEREDLKVYCVSARLMYVGEFASDGPNDSPRSFHVCTF